MGFLEKLFRKKAIRPSGSGTASTAASDVINNLIRDLADADWVQRPQGSVAFATQTAFEAKEKLIAAGKKAVPAVIDCLTGQGMYNQRAMAAQVLGDIGDYQAVDVLIKMLDDPHLVVRGYSAEALGKIGDRRAVTPLRNMANNPVENPSAKAYAEGALKCLQSASN